MEHVSSGPTASKNFRSSAGFIAFGVSLAAFTETFLYGLIIPLLPFTLTQRLNIPHDEVQSAISYLLPTFGVGSIFGSILAPFLASRSSNQLPYLLSLITLAASTFLFAIGRSMPLLLLARVLQGLSSGAVWTVGLVILNSVVSEGQSGKMMGFANAAAACGYMAGPAVGGLVYDFLGYYPVYGVAGGLVLCDVVLRLAMKFPSKASGFSSSAAGSEAERAKPSPALRPESALIPSAAEAASEITPLVSSIEAPSDKRPRGNRYLLFAFLRSPRFLTALLVCFAEHIIFTGLETILPVRLSQTLHWNSSRISLAFLILVLPSLLSPMIGLLSDHIGANIVSGAALTICTPAVAALGLIKGRDSGSMVAFLVGMITLGIGVAGIITPVMSVVGDIAADVVAKTKSAEYDDQEAGAATTADRGDMGQRDDERVQDLSGMIYGATNVTMSATSIVGPLLSGWIVQELGWSAATLGIGLVAMIAAIAVFLFLGKAKRS